MPPPGKKRILLANELGAGWGHLRPWLATLEEFARTQHWVGVAANAQSLETDWAPVGVTALEAPPPPGAQAPGRHAVYSWPQLLVSHGYADLQKTQPALRAWMALLQRHRVDHLVVDHAPLALVAAKALGIGVTEAGSGFLIPPATEPMPPFWPVPPTAAEALRAAEMQLRDRWTGLIGQAPASLLQGHARHVCSIAALDPYGPRSGVDYVGPLPASRPASPPTPADEWWSENQGEILAYLKVHTPGLREILRALGRSGRRVLAGVPGLGSERADGQLRVTSTAVDLPGHIRTARLLMTNGGIHSTGLGIAARVPLVLVPMHAEQWLTAQRVVRHGWGTFWHPRLRSADSLRKVLQGV